MAHKLQLRALLAGLSFLPPAGGGDCFSSLGMLGSNTAQLGALEVQMVICGFLDVGIVECARAHAVYSEKAPVECAPLMFREFLDLTAICCAPGWLSRKLL